MIFKSLSIFNLARLCLVNRSLHGLIEPDLYANIQWTWESSRQPKSIARFVRTILRKPQLGQYVRTLVLMGVLPARYKISIPFNISILDQGDLSKCVISELLNTSVTSTETWFELLQAGKMDAWVALLIAHLPNLTSLHLGPRFTANNPCLGLLLRYSLCESPNHRLPKFEHLRTLNFNTGRFSHSTLSERHRNAPNALSFFYLPSLQRIRTSFDTSGDFTWPALGGEAPVLHNLTELDLGCPFRAVHLGKLLSATPNLKSLRWDWYHEGTTTPFGDVGVIELGQIAAALSLVQESLAELAITARCTFGANKRFSQCTSRGSLQPLAAFPSLKSLQAPIAFLMGWTRDQPHWKLSDVIPQTVEAVSIMDELWYHHPTYIWNEEAIFDVIKAWLAPLERIPPNLRHFQLSSKNIAEQDLGPVTNELRALGSPRGVKVDILTQRRPCSLNRLPLAV